VDDEHDIIEVARAMIATFGASAPAIVEERVLKHLEASEQEGADLWQRVADAIRKIERGES
jgi:hypothetical protein